MADHRLDNSLSDDDLVAIIEGDVSPERAGALRAAIMADPALRARLQHLAADRDLLARLPDEIAAPSDTVARAMARAASATPEPVAPGARHRRIAMAIAASFGILVIGGLFVVVLNATHPSLRSGRTASLPRQAGEIRGIAGDTPEVDPIGPVAEASGAADAPTTTAQDIAAEIQRLAEAETTDPVLDEFLRNIDDRTATAAGAGLTDAQLAALVRENRLEIVLTMRGPRGTGLATDPADAPRVPVETPIPATIALSVPVDATDAEIRDAVDWAIRSWKAEPGIGVEFRQGTAPASSAVADTRPGTVIWWSQPPSLWRSVRSHTIPVRTQAGDITPDAQPQQASD